MIRLCKICLNCNMLLACRCNILKWYVLMFEYNRSSIMTDYINIKLNAWYQQTSEIKITCYKEAQLYDGAPKMYDIAILSSPVRCPEISRSQCLCTCVHLKETGIENAGA